MEKEAIALITKGKNRFLRDDGFEMALVQQDHHASFSISTALYFLEFCLLWILLFLMAASRIVSLNVNGMRDNSKRKSVFGWARSHNSYFFMLQETHKTYSDKWDTEWSGQSIWAHGSNFSRGCAILIKPNSAFMIRNSRTDVDGRGGTSL